MKTMLAGVAAVLVLGLTGWGAEPAASKAAPEKSAEELSRGDSGRKPTPTEVAILKALETTHDWDYDDQTLGNVMERLGDAYKMPVKFDQKAKSADGKPLAETKISFRLKNVPLRTALRLMLEDHDLDWTVRDGVLFITTEENVRDHVEIRVYDVADLRIRPKPDGGVALADPEDLIETIAQTVSPESWDGVGGAGTIRDLDRDGANAPLLVVSQTWRIHDQIADLLTALRRQRRLEGIKLSDGTKLDAKRWKELITNPEPARGGAAFGDNEPPPKLAPDDARDAIAQTNNDFTLRLYGQVRKGEGNLFVSPYSVAQALAMCQIGARGETATEFAAVLPTKLDAPRVQPGWAALRSALKSEGKSAYALNVANRLWVDQRYSLRAEFLRDLEAHHDANPGIADFRQPAAAAKAINAWVSEQTHKKIPELVSPNEINDATALVLVNAIYFRGQWRHPFEKADTEDLPFHLGEKSPRVPTMKQTVETSYADIGDGAALLTLPYAGGSLAMTILLPLRGKPDAIATMEQALSGESWAKWLAARNVRLASVRLPKFTFRWGSSLNEPLQALGLKRAFVPGAEFSGIGEGDLYLQWMNHEAFVEVHEEGTEAAAASGAGGDLFGGPPPPRPVEFHVDRPFLFVIHDERTGAILFIGRVTDPQPPAQ